MYPKTPLNSWILTKIMSYLETKEGCTPNELETTQHGMKGVFTDSFGYQYEINIKAYGRINPGFGESLNEDSTQNDILRVPAQVLEKISR